MTRKKIVDSLIEEINKGMEEVYKSDNWKNHLETMSQFHKYSSNNLMLIKQQNPNASLIASFNKWKELGRYIKKGQKALKVLYPMEFKVEEENKNGEIEEAKKVTFKYGNVFDISQTSGKKLDLFKLEDLKGEVEFYDDIMNVFESMAEEIGYTLCFNKLDSNLKGLCNYETKKITINSNVEELQKIKTCIHELAHAVTHDPLKDKKLNPLETKLSLSRSEKEIQAESIAYIVSHSLGLDTSDYSFKYIASWGEGKSSKQIGKTLTEIRKISLGLTDRIKNELVDEKEKEVERKSLKEILGEVNKEHKEYIEKNKSKGKSQNQNKEIEIERG